jgi:hypothetical protein
MTSRITFCIIAVTLAAALAMPGVAVAQTSPVISGGIAALAPTSLSITAAGHPISTGPADLRVMNYNIYEGTNFTQIGQAQGLDQFLLAVGDTIEQVRATNPPARMQAVAAQILQAAPTLVSLEEVAQWSTGPFDPRTQTCGALTLEFDTLQELLSSLAAQGGHYRVAV